MNDFRGGGHRAKVHRHNRAGGQGVGHAALEDDVHIHEPVAHDGVTKGQGQEDERENRELGGQRGGGDWRQQVRDGVKKSKWGDSKNGPPRHPLHLLPEDRSLGVAIAVPENARGGREVCGQIEHLQPIKIPAQQLAGAG